jgi:hypothetical protein
VLETMTGPLTAGVPGSAIRAGSITLSSVSAPLPSFAEPLAQSFGEVAERVGGLSQARVLLFEHGDPLLEHPDV